MRASLASSLVLASVLLGTPAFADAPGPTPAPSSRAEQLFREGRIATDAGDYKTACARFAESERLEPAPGTLLNIADCEEHLGQLVAAREHWNLAASGFRKDDNRRQFATSHAAALEGRLVHLTLRLAPGVPPDASIRKAGVPVDRASLGQSLATDPGAVSVLVSASGRDDRSYALDLKEGQSLEVTLDVGGVSAAPAVAAAGGPAAARDASVEQPPPTRTIGFVVGGVGLAALAAGGVFGVLALGKASTVKDHCDANYVCDQTGVDAGSSGQTFALVSTISFVAGAALVGTGVYLVLSSRGKGRSDDAPHATLSIAPFGMRGGAGAATTLSF